MPLVQTRGAASAQGFGEFAQASAVPNYIEDVFSTYLYTGNGTSQTITNNIDLSGKGGLTWIKVRTHTYDHILTDTVRGATTEVFSDLTAGNITNTDDLTSFTSSGFSVGNGSAVNSGSPVRDYVSWTWRKQPKFFDIVTYTGTGSNTTVAHNLGSVPGCIMVKRTDTSSAWAVYHRSLANTQYLVLNTTAAAATGATWWNSTTPTSAVFSLGTDASVNASGGTYVAYIFAHDAGGFGLTGTDNVISCGTFTTNGSGLATVNLGYEPQWLLMKATDASNWLVFDNMRNWSKTGFDELNPNLSAGESNYTSTNFSPTATGFQFFGNVYGSSRTFIYIAIRRGPMKVPTVGTSVLNITTSVGTNPAYVSSFPPDFAYRRQITGTSDNYFHTRLQGAKTLYPNYTFAEDDDANVTWGYQNGMFTSTGANSDQYGWLMRRAPSFMDVVCYTGGSPYNRTHNLTVVPELMIVKCRDTAYNWAVYSSALGNTKYLRLSSTAAVQTDTDIWSSTTPTATTFYGGPNSDTSGGGALYVAYLFATCAGVSKVGSYTGNGTTQTINCGFTGGARFVIIKRTDSTGGWYVYDTVRGMTTLTDPYVFLNSNAVQVATLGSVTTVSTGFALNSTILAAINESGGNYIFLAVA